MNELRALYRQSLGLLTDLYELTMAYGYWKTGRADDEAVFHVAFRRTPFQGAYAIACGIETALDYLEDVRFDESDIAYLATLCGVDGEPLFEVPFLEFLRPAAFQCDVDAVPEGTVVFAHEPLMRVRGPLWQAQFVETALLTIVNFQTLIATKASRVCWAAGGDPVIDFGLRRAQGIDGGLSASRAAYVGGCEATSNVLAGKLFDIPVRGTHAHSWVMSFDSEREAFDVYANTMPHNCVLLVDTYDTVGGLERAIEVGLRLKAAGRRLLGVRLDSGDLVELSKTARRMLDDAGLNDAHVLASGDLDEYEIKKLRDRGAPIGAWGVGTRLVTAFDQPALGGVYKLASIRRPGGEWRDLVKLSDDPHKSSLPGPLQTRRFLRSGRFVGDVVFNDRDGMSPNARQRLGLNRDARQAELPDADEFEDLLRPVMAAGRRVSDRTKLADARALAQAQLSKTPTDVRRIADPVAYQVGLEGRLWDERWRLVDEVVAHRSNEQSGALGNGAAADATNRRALVLVDLQRDFMPGGTLAVAHGDEVVAVANRLQPAFDLVVATRDWHPADHVSFAASHPGRRIGDAIEIGGVEHLLWPVHCVQNTEGAKLAADLDAARITHIVDKGTDRRVDSYSAFFDNARQRSTGLADWLQERRVAEIYIAGLATDYCVAATAADALDLGLRVVVVTDGCRAVDLRANDGKLALDRLVRRGARLVTSDEALAALGRSSA